MTTPPVTTRPFHWRAFVTFSVVMMFLVIAMTGIVLFITPPGRIANWSEWRLLGFSKAQWQTVHTVFSFIFVVTASVHLFFNWKVILGYLARKYRDGINKRRELGASLTAGVIILVMAAAGVPPFSSLMAWGEDLKNGWAASEPPVPHAELLTLTRLAGEMQLPPDRVMQMLAAHGLVADSAGMTVRDLARKYDLTPKQVYDRIPGAGNATGKRVAGTGPGYGRKTVQMVCEEEGIDTPAALARLTAAGITSDGSMSIRSLSQSAGKTPVEIVGIIRGNTAEQEE